MFGKKFKFSAPSPLLNSRQEYIEDAQSRRTNVQVLEYQDGTTVTVEFMADGSFTISSSAKLKVSPFWGQIKAE